MRICHLHHAPEREVEGLDDDSSSELVHALGCGVGVLNPEVDAPARGDLLSPEVAGPTDTAHGPVPDDARVEVLFLVGDGQPAGGPPGGLPVEALGWLQVTDQDVDCLLYTSDAADD